MLTLIVEVEGLHGFKPSSTPAQLEKKIWRGTKFFVMIKAYASQKVLGKLQQIIKFSYNRQESCCGSCSRHVKKIVKWKKIELKWFHLFLQFYFVWWYNSRRKKSWMYGRIISLFETTGCLHAGRAICWGHQISVWNNLKTSFCTHDITLSILISPMRSSFVFSLLHSTKASHLAWAHDANFN